jgi:acyl dehydratase
VVPAEAEPIAEVALDARAGLDFAVLTGDVNPIHWLRPYARAAGFRSTILHGFATLARACEALVGARLGGDPARLAAIDARFVAPLPLPARVQVLAREDAVWVGDSAGGVAYLEGRFERG